MVIAITMAGMGLRFRKAGFGAPKYTIPVKGKTLFEWSMLSLSGFFGAPNVTFIFIARQADKSQDFISSKASSLGIKNFKIIEIDHPTDGQATTATLALAQADPQDELIIYNIDTYVEPGAIKYQDISGDGFIPCFNAPGNHWSFVKLNSQGQATEVREKNRISDNCTIGFYYFKTCQLYQGLYHAYYSNESHIEHHEKYVAPLYNHMIAQGLDVRIATLPSDKVHVLGTPAEVKTFEES